MLHKNASEKSIPVAIVGARGYTGLELARILLTHPTAQLKACLATDAAFDLSQYLPEASAAGVPIHAVTELENLTPGLKTVFLATPAEVSAELAPSLLKAGVDVIDLSGAFRLQAAQYPKWYGFTHRQPELLAQAEYGLSPWAGPAKTSHGPRLIANPGCYATAISMALLPLLKSGLIRPETLVIDAKSGTSGAGKKASESLLFTEVEGECLPYKVAAHQHFPEIQETAARFAGAQIDPMLSTHLINVRRGIVAGLYARLAPGKNAEAVAQAYAQSYAGYDLVRVSSPSSQALSLKRVVGSARTHLSYAVDGDKLYVYSLIDNLLKGAASQAIENFNRLNDLPVATALSEMEGIL